MNKLILVLLALALAVSPMRTALALPVPASSDGDSHCMSMQAEMNHAMPGMHHPAETADTGELCRAGCSGDCCDDACNHCVHPVAALFDVSPVAAGLPQPRQKLALASHFPDRTVIPPLRPPASP